MPKPLKILVYPLFAVLSLFLFLIILFPFESVKDRLATEIEQSLGGQVSITIGGLAPSPVSGIILNEVEVRPDGDTNAAPVKISKAKLTFGIFTLFSGVIEVDYHLQIGKGWAEGSCLWKRGNTRVALTMKDLDLALANIFTRQSGVELAGIADGAVQLEIYPEDPLRNSGKISLQMPELKILSVTIPGNFFEVPAMVLAQEGAPASKAEITINRGNIEIKQIHFSGGDFELQTDGKIYGARKTENYRFNLK